MKDEIKEILESLDKISKAEYYPEDLLSYKECKILLDYITNLKILYDKTTTDLVKESHARMKLQEENDYLKDIVSNTELSDEIKKADKWSKRELYKINYQRLKANQRLQEAKDSLQNDYQEAVDKINELKQENERLKLEKQEEYNRFNLIAKFRDRALERELIYKSRIDKAIEKLKTLMPICIMPNNMLIQGTEKAKIIEEALNILQGSDKE